jgi:hypothetical protein
VNAGVATSTTQSCTITGLTNGTPYYFAAFTKDTRGNYSFAVTPAGSPVTPAVPPVPAPEWNATDWTTYDTITIDATNIDDDLTDFPVYVDLADLGAAFWSTTPTSSALVGTDIRVTTNDGTPIELPRELVTASSTAETGELHFKANVISSTTDTVFRIYYNGTTTGDYAKSSTYGAQNVWSEYLAVLHLGETVNNSPDGYRDSTGNGHDGTGSSMSLNAPSGRLSGQAQSFDGSIDYIKLADGVIAATQTNTTVSVWFKTALALETNGKAMYAERAGSGSDIFKI